TILNPRTSGLVGAPNYEAIACDWAPRQGRSGGGLYTSDGYLAGVCDFAEPRGNTGLYAAPRSIYKILDRNDMSDLYRPANAGDGRLLASKDRTGRSPRRTGSHAPPVTIARAQSPDREESRERPKGQQDLRPGRTAASVAGAAKGSKWQPAKGPAAELGP